MSTAVAPDTIDLLAKQAARDFLRGGAGLNKTIVKQARAHGLSPHHVQRVAERANLVVHGTLYKGASATEGDRNIDFPIARPEEIQEELSEKDKLASARAEGVEYGHAPDRSWSGVTPDTMAKTAADPSYVGSAAHDDEDLWPRLKRGVPKEGSATSVALKGFKFTKRETKKKKKKKKKGEGEKTETEVAQDQLESRGLERGLNKAAQIGKVAERLAVSAEQRRDISFGTLVKRASDYLRDGTPFTHVQVALMTKVAELPETPEVIAKLAKSLYESGKLDRRDLQKCAAMLADPAFVSNQIPPGQLVNGNLSIVKTLDTLVNAAREGDQMRQRCKQLCPDRSVSVRAVEL